MPTNPPPAPTAVVATDAVFARIDDLIHAARDFGANKSDATYRAERKAEKALVEALASAEQARGEKDDAADDGTVRQLEDSAADWEREVATLYGQPWRKAADLIVSDLLDLDPTDYSPNDPNTITTSVEDLRIIVERHTQNAQRETATLTERVERAEAERNAWRAFAEHQELCRDCAEDVGSCADGRSLRDAALRTDAPRGETVRVTAEPTTDAPRCEQCGATLRNEFVIACIGSDAARDFCDFACRDAFVARHAVAPESSGVAAPLRCDRCTAVLGDSVIIVTYGDGKPAQNYCGIACKNAAERARAAAPGAGDA